MNKLLKKIILILTLIITVIIIFIPYIDIFAALPGGYCHIDPPCNGTYYYFPCPSDICGNVPALAICLICVSN
jgi:hypothetical protein